jgi:CheY-like chemotaxis protein
MRSVPTPQTGGCVLIVEDDTDLRESLADLLQDEGYRVAGAANGEEALQYLRTSPPPCIVLLDLMMPVMNGWELREHMQQDPLLSSIPVAIVTGVRNTEDRIAALNPVGYFQKPVDINALLATVATYC